MKKKRRSTKKVILLLAAAAVVCLVLVLGFILWPSSKSEAKFDVSDEVQFYVVANDGIAGYRLENTKPVRVTETKTRVVKGNLNPAVKRAELENRYLVFTDDDWPKGKDEGLVSIDFSDGTILFQKTHQTGYTAAGSAGGYYLAETNNRISAYTPDLKETDTMDLDPAMILTDFRSDTLPFLAVGSDLDGSMTDDGNLFFKDRLVKGDIQDGKLVIEAVSEIETNSWCQYWFTDSLFQNGVLYAASPGYRLHENHESVSDGAIYRYEPETGNGQFIPLGTDNLTEIYEAGKNRLALTSSPDPSGPMNLLLFDTVSAETQSIEINGGGINAENAASESIMDVQSLSDDVLLILTSQRLIGYNPGLSQTVFEMDLSADQNSPFHLWIND